MNYFAKMLMNGCSFDLFYLHSTAGEAVGGATFGAGSGPIFLDDVHCTSTESSLLNCSSNPIGSTDCTHSQDAGVICEGTTSMIMTQ